MRGLATFLTAAVLLVGTIDGAAQRTVFRAGVDLVSLSVTVTDTNKRYVTDLNPEDFVITENGVPQRLTFFAKSGIPMAVAVLIDTSASMEQSLSTAQDAAIGFVRQLEAADVAAVVDFDSSVKTLQPFTTDHDALEAAIRDTAAGGATALYNAVYIALRELNKRVADDDPDSQRRRAIVVLSDGEDTSSLLNFEELLDAAARSDTVIYTIGLGGNPGAATRRSDNGQFVMRRLAQQTGGAAFFPADVRDLAQVYADIRRDLANQYTLAYESGTQSAEAQWRQLTVRVTRPSTIVRTRQGYYARRAAASAK